MLEHFIDLRQNQFMELSRPDYQITLDPNGILHGVVTTENYLQTYDDMRLDFEFFKKVRRTTRQKVRLIWQPGQGFKQEPRATQFAQSAEMTGVIGCMAVVDASMMTRVVVNALTSIRPIQYPFKMVSSHEEALEFHAQYDQFLPLKNKVLLVDDEEFLTEVFAEVIEAMGYFAEVADSNDALRCKLASGEKPEFIILDYRLRGHYFSDNFKIVKELAPLSRLIVMTGDITLDRRKIDAEAIWIKPFEITEKFRELIQEC